MNTRKLFCGYCGKVTEQACPECDACCCFSCGVNRCPLCVRVKLAQVEHALRSRLVAWQHIEASILPLVSSSSFFYHDPTEQKVEHLTSVVIARADFLC